MAAAPPATLRFITPDKSEIVVLALGVHNYKRWGDIVTNDQKTGLQINGEYYNSGFRASAREAQLAEYSVKNAQGRNFQLKYVEPNGNNLKVQFIIG
ncbi:hypothetical protein BT96DRAFT_573888 [Gymnopus androsaceus JB14]|uniref:Uncharacterized protein n=1 Tax=Gymnopus androsaceus JB14 TaxID=1447944 RepID=A0A6A4HS35_9AGAR|nr:hypothetical protein BT96DRAFT_573888 [Gymnopus androsaceus JB14]